MDPFDRLTNLTTIAEEAELISLTGTPSVRSGTTVGLGTLSSRAIMAVGEYAVKGIENVNIRRKLGIASFQLRQQGAVPKQVIDDLLELQRMGLYSAPLRERACDLLMATLIKQGLEETIQLLKQWSAIEIQYFLRQFAAFKLTRWHTSGDNTLVTDQLAVTSVCARLIQAVLDKDPTMIHRRL
ncbi:unnamed protein product [Somion occarium]|uniref:Uncharacterized protein n=1 Tax=Somion occarium TaxID=3059160 RepID=A0ABP1DJ23_9APHY